MACFYALRLHEDPPLVILADQSIYGGQTITNAADVVVDQLRRVVPDLARRRVIYRDTDGVYDELRMDATCRFVDFHLIRARTVEAAIEDIAKGRI